MSWAEIKHALNNTLGTSLFLPLNELITAQNSIAYSEDFANIFYQSEDVETGKDDDSTKWIYSSKVQILTNGAVGIACLSKNVGQSAGVQYRVMKNGNDIISGYIYSDDFSTDMGYYDKISRVIVTCGDVIQFRIAQTNLGQTISRKATLYLLGSLSHNPLRVIE